MNTYHKIITGVSVQKLYESTVPPAVARVGHAFLKQKYKNHRPLAICTLQERLL